MLRRRWLAILAPTLIVVGAAMTYASVAESNLEPVYSATLTLAANPEREINAVALEQLVILLNEGEVSEQAELALPDDVEAGASAAAFAEIAGIQISSESTDPDDAVIAAETYSDALIAYVNNEDVQAYTTQLATVSDELELAEGELNLLDIAVFSSPDDLALQSDRDDALVRLRAAQDAVRAIEAQGIPEPQLSVLAGARASEVPPSGFVGMPLERQIAIALVIGLVAGIAFAYLLEAIDRRLGSAVATSEAFGMPVLAEVPYAGKAFERSREIAPMGSMLMESYRRLRTIVQLERDTSERQSEGASVILVVSGSPSEGKTVTASHLAVALGETGNKVLLISADFRRPALHDYFHVDPTGGIAALAAGAPDANDTLVKPTRFRGVRLITAGRGHPEPTELIHHAKRVIEEARGICDYLVIDSSPILSANDALDFVNLSDVVIVVSRFKQTTTPAAHRVRDTLFQTDAPVLGVVTTGVRKGEGYGYYYGADYEPHETVDVTQPSPLSSS